MFDINEYVSKNYNDNILYFEKKHTELFSKIAALESAVENGHYIEKYELVYENDSFDVIEKSTNNYLYNKKSIKHSELATKNIDFGIEYDTFEGFKNHAFSNDMLKRFRDEGHFSHAMLGFAPIIFYCEEHSQKNKKLSSIEKFIFFGAGLGLHIESIHKKLSSKVYFIIEDDLELFRLSLFTVNYAEIAKDSTLIFSVFEDDNEFNKSANKFLETEFYYNQYIKYFLLLSHSKDKIQKFHSTITSQPHLNFWYSRLLKENLRPIKYLFDNYKILDKTINLKSNKIIDNPFLLLAPGPSLQKQIQWLKQHHNKFIIVALSATISTLEKNNIPPDIVVHLDSFRYAVEHFTKLDSINFIKDSILLFSTQTPYEIISMLNHENLFLFENGTKYKDSSFKPAAPCVGSLAYQILLYLQVKSIYLLGLDLAIDVKTGKTHSDSHSFTRTVMENKDSNSMTYKETPVEIKANFKETTITTLHFKSSIDSINNSTQAFKQNFQKVYNLSDGAIFLDTIPIYTNKINISKKLSKENIRKSIHNTFLNNSSAGLNKNEIKNIKNKLLHAKNIEKIILTFKIKEYKSVSYYIDELKNLCTKLITKRDIVEFELSRVLDIYLRYILTYIFDFLNSNTTNNEEEHIKSLNAMLIENLLNITEYYQDRISKYIDE